MFIVFDVRLEFWFGKNINTFICAHEVKMSQTKSLGCYFEHDQLHMFFLKCLTPLVIGLQIKAPSSPDWILGA